MEIKTYKMLLSRWAWIFIVAVIIGGFSGYVGSQLVPPAYRANTKVMIFQTQQDENSEFANMNNEQLVQTYLELFKSGPIIEETSIRLNYDINASENVRVLQIQDTQFIQISVVDADPELAASFANTLVMVLIEQNESIQIDRYITTVENLIQRKTQIEEQISQLRLEFTQVSEEVIQNQLVQVNTQISLLEEEITTLYKEIAELGSPALFTTQSRIDLADKEARLSQIQPLILQYQQIRTNLEILGRSNNSGPDQEDLHLDQLQGTIDLYQIVQLDILRSIESVQLLRLQNTPNILQIETASPPENAFRPIPILFAVIGSAIGLAIAAFVAYFTESLDTSFKSIEDIQQTLDLPVYGFMNEKELIAISRRGKLTIDGSFPIPNNINSLITNLELMNTVSGEAPKSLIIASVDPDSYKSIIIANLAISYAQMGKNIILVDANMEHPQVHKYLGLPNKEGLMDMLTGKLAINKMSTQLDQLRKMTVITGGNATTPQSGLLKSSKMDNLLEKLNEKYDVVLIDSPSLKLSDTWILASKIEMTLLVIRPGHTQPSEAQAAANNLTRAGANIAGIFLTRIPPKLKHLYS